MRYINTVMTHALQHATKQDLNYVEVLAEQQEERAVRVEAVVVREAEAER
jgi:hypothetical protein